MACLRERAGALSLGQIRFLVYDSRKQGSKDFVQTPATEWGAPRGSARPGGGSFAQVPWGHSGKAHAHSASPTRASFFVVGAAGFLRFYLATVCIFRACYGATGRTGAAEEESRGRGRAAGGAVSGAEGGSGSPAGDLKGRSGRGRRRASEEPGSGLKDPTRGSRRVCKAGVRFVVFSLGPRSGQSPETTPLTVHFFF